MGSEKQACCDLISHHLREPNNDLTVNMTSPLLEMLPHESVENMNLQTNHNIVAADLHTALPTKKDSPRYRRL